MKPEGRYNTIMITSLLLALELGIPSVATVLRVDAIIQHFQLFHVLNKSINRIGNGD